VLHHSRDPEEIAGRAINGWGHGPARAGRASLGPRHLTVSVTAPGNRPSPMAMPAGSESELPP